MKKTPIIFLIMLPIFGALLLLAAGCGNTVNTVERAQPVGEKQMVSDKRIITDAGLNDYAKVIGVNQTTVSGNILKIQVELRNTTRSAKRINYKFEWFDMDGMIVDSPTTMWKTEVIEAKETKTLTAVAPNPRAKDFRLKLQDAK